MTKIYQQSCFCATIYTSEKANNGLDLRWKKFPIVLPARYNFYKEKKKINAYLLLLFLGIIFISKKAKLQKKKMIYIWKKNMHIEETQKDEIYRQNKHHEEQINQSRNINEKDISIIRI